MKRIIVGITGATGIVYGVRLLEVLKESGIEAHAVLSESAEKNIAIETNYSLSYVRGLAHAIHDVGDVAAPISSGSFKTEGMVIAPCTIKTLSGVANSFNENLIIRAADVVLKERRRLILLVRETPLHEGHLEMTTKVARCGGIILPPVPAFYHSPKTIQDLIDQTIGKVLDLFGIEHSLYKRWQGKQG
jgi:flavin prenyltransferase